jgi:hypothetical protein
LVNMQNISKKLSVKRDQQSLEKFIFSEIRAKIEDHEFGSCHLSLTYDNSYIMKITGFVFSLEDIWRLKNDLCSRPYIMGAAFFVNEYQDLYKMTPDSLKAELRRLTEMENPLFAEIWPD